MRREDDGDRRNRRMVDQLVRRGDIVDPAIEAAFRDVRRHWFLPGVPLDDVYADRAVVTHRSPEGEPLSSSSQPALMARMLAQLAVQPGRTVLEIGTGTGYNAALLGRLVGPGGAVVTVDVDPEVAGPAAQHLRAAGATNVSVVCDDGWTGRGLGAVLDRVEVTVGVWDLSPAWLDELVPGGVLVAPLWLRAGMQASIAFTHSGDGLGSTSLEPCGFMRMRGPGAGDASYVQVGQWSVSQDRPGPETSEAVAALLATPPRVEPAPPLAVGWFTSIALAEPGAVHLFTSGRRESRLWAGLLQTSPPGLAVVESHAAGDDRILAFGSGEPLRRLRELLDGTPPVDPTTLAVTATPTGTAASEAADALAVLVRPAFTFVLRARA